jgi:hypothetical protein
MKILTLVSLVYFLEIEEIKSKFFNLEFKAGKRT